MPNFSNHLKYQCTEKNKYHTQINCLILQIKTALKIVEKLVKTKKLNLRYTICEGSGPTGFSVFLTLGLGMLYCPCPVQVDRLMRDYRCLVPNEVWYSFYRSRRDEIINEPYPAEDRTVDLQCDSQSGKNYTLRKSCTKVTRKRKIYTLRKS